MESEFSAVLQQFQPTPRPDQLLPACFSCGWRLPQKSFHVDWLRNTRRTATLLLNACDFGIPALLEGSEYPICSPGRSGMGAVALGPHRVPAGGGAIAWGLNGGFTLGLFCVRLETSEGHT